MDSSADFKLMKMTNADSPDGVMMEEGRTLNISIQLNRFG